MADAPLEVWREHEGRLLRLRLNRPKANIVDAEMIAALDAAFAGLEQNRGCPGRLITSLYQQAGNRQQNYRTEVFHATRP